jgi:hypothetical protein
MNAHQVCVQFEIWTVHRLVVEFCCGTSNFVKERDRYTEAVCLLK